MKARDLPRVVVPPPPPTKVCQACKVFRPEVLVPYDGNGAVECCWLCAHHIVEHDCLLETAMNDECDCMPTEIYPHRYFATTDEEFEQRRDEILARRASC